jgi:C4-dicarboxylate-specific signal transduction histidine kinase
MAVSASLAFSKFRQPSAILRYAIAAVSVAVALVAAELANTFLQTAPIVSLFLCAIMFATWFGGVGPGLLGTAFSLLAFDYYLMPPINSLLVEPKNLLRIVLFAIPAFFVVSLIAGQRRSTQSLQRARDDLQAAVQTLEALNKALQVENAERKQAEEKIRHAEDALRRSEGYLAEAQRLSRTGSFSWNVLSGDLYWSEQTFRIFEYEQFITPTIELVRQRVHPDDIAIFHEVLDRMRHGEQDIEANHRLLLPGGVIKDIYLLAHATTDQSGTSEYVGALMDVTAANQAQDALERIRAELAHVTRLTTLGELTASIAHEVKQPIAAISTNGQASLRWLAREVPDIGEALAALRLIVSDADRASGVIQRIHQLSKKADPKMIQLDINGVIDEVITLVQREALSHRVTIWPELAPGLPLVHGDRIQLQQVIINLVINGVQAMATVTDRARELFIRTRRHASDQVLVVIQDVGTGIEAEHLDRLFTAFYTTKSNGLGMGLTICRSIIEAHGGRVWASQNIGPGMAFQFTISAAARAT